MVPFDNMAAGLTQAFGDKFDLSATLAMSGGILLFLIICACICCKYCKKTSHKKLKEVSGKTYSVRPSFSENWQCVLDWEKEQFESAKLDTDFSDNLGERHFTQSPRLPSSREKYAYIVPQNLPRPHSSVVQRVKRHQIGIPQALPPPPQKQLIHQDNILIGKADPKYPSPRFDIIEKKLYSVKI